MWYSPRYATASVTHGSTRCRASSRSRPKPPAAELGFADPADRKPAEQDGERDQEQHPEPELRHRVRDHREGSQLVVAPGTA